MDLTIIVAVSENNVIGVNGKIPWRIKEDMQKFKEITLHHPVIMGRKTYESIPERFRPLPDRDNIVLSRTLGITEGISVARTIDEALTMARLGNELEPYIIGGEETYRLFFPLSSNIELTRVYRTYSGDRVSYFPEMNMDEWNLIGRQDRLISDELGDLKYSFLTYERKQP